MTDAPAKAAKRKIRAPKVHAEDNAFWDATAEGKLLVPWCRECGKPFWYPRAICPLCLSDAVEFREGSGRGEIYTYSVQRRGAEEPYAIAYVRLDEGVTVLTNLVECDFDTLHIGQRVRTRFVDTGEGNALPMFAPE